MKQNKYQAVLTKHIGDNVVTEYHTDYIKRRLIRKMTAELYGCKFECDMAFVTVCDVLAQFTEVFNARLTNENGKFSVRRIFNY